MLLLLILYPLCSCGGNVTVPLGVIIYIYKDNLLRRWWQPLFVQ